MFHNEKLTFSNPYYIAKVNGRIYHKITSHDATHTSIFSQPNGLRDPVGLGTNHPD